jgi:hypothetical protein
MPATRLAAFSCLLCLACSADGGHTLQVNLRSDLRSGIEVVVARAELFDEAPAPGQTAPANLARPGSSTRPCLSATGSA